MESKIFFDLRVDSEARNRRLGAVQDGSLIRRTSLDCRPVLRELRVGRGPTCWTGLGRLPLRLSLHPGTPKEHKAREGTLKGRVVY